MPLLRDDGSQTNKTKLIRVFAAHSFECVLAACFYVPGRGERGVNQSFVRQIGHALDLVEVERIVAGQGAVQTGLDERGPVVSQHGFPAHVVFAHSGDPRVHPLKH